MDGTFCRAHPALRPAEMLHHSNKVNVNYDGQLGARQRYDSNALTGRVRIGF